MPLAITPIPALRDNYIWLVRESTGQTAVVDPSVAEPVLDALENKGWTLDVVLNTHHHYDHTGGNLELKAKTGCRIVGPKADEARIPGIDLALADGEPFALGDAQAVVIDIPGHTRGHIAFYFADDRALFCGDTLFAMGCGRLFEGTPAQMWTSLSRLALLPKETLIYCGHEYTQANARFALTVEPGNRALNERAKAVAALRWEGRVTLPSSIGEELATNPFLRAMSPEIQKSVGLGPEDPIAVFAEVRRRKDYF
jgi:hydroxyacylglutathione hydrolase